MKMISAKKIRTLKPRVQLRRSADAFHEAAATDPGKDYLDEIVDIIMSSEILSPSDKDRIRFFYSKGDSLSFEDIYYFILSSLGDVPADWDAVDETGNIDWSTRSILPHYLFLDHIRSPYNVGSIFRSAESFQVSGIYIAPGSASPEHPRARRTSRGTVDGVDWKEMDLADIPSSIPVFALETGGEDIATFSFPEHGICIIGSEEDGISAEARKRADASFGIVSIPQHGAKGSLNVSAAAAILLYKWQENATLR